MRGPENAKQSSVSCVITQSCDSLDCKFCYE
jgi:hypothetical protein